jgi:hypothetical protein
MMGPPERPDKRALSFLPGQLAIASVESLEWAGLAWPLGGSGGRSWSWWWRWCLRVLAHARTLMGWHTRSGRNSPHSRSGAGSEGPAPS